MDAAAMLEQARAMLASNNLPINAANLNRASLAIARGETMLEPESASPRSTQRSMQSRTRSQGNMPTPPQQPLDDSGNRVRLTDGANPLMDNINAQIEAGGMGSNTAPADALPVEDTNTTLPVRRGSMPRAQRIDEENPEAGMYSNVPPRQADETGVDAMGLATALGLPFAALLGAPVAASRAIPQMRVTLNRPQLTGPGAGGSPQLPGTSGMPPVGGPSMPPGVSGPGAQARLSAPQALIERARRRVSETAGRSRRDGMRND